MILSMGTAQPTFILQRFMCRVGCAHRCRGKTMKIILRLITVFLGFFIFTSISSAADSDNAAKNGDRFISNKTTVTDTRTGLMWAAGDNGADISLVDAQAYCENYTGGGYDDWRLPTQDELATLFELEAYKSSSYSIVADIKLTGCCPWASDRKDARVASFDFEYGNPDWGHPMSTINARALPVRAAAGLQSR